MKEFQINFSAPMIRAILEGRKTQDRRIVGRSHLPWIENGIWKERRIPYGLAGDRLWVKEPWKTDKSLDDKQPSMFCNSPIEYVATGDIEKHGALFGNTDGKIRAPINMPRWASRIDLAIADVRIERVQGITETNAIAEGAKRFACLPSKHAFGQDARWSMGTPTRTDQCFGSARYAFANQFSRINGKNAWYENPMVWVIEFSLNKAG
ncbi:MAG: hypothetical protein WAW61_21725 [Methylococcaceae bacterium]